MIEVKPEILLLFTLVFLISCHSDCDYQEISQPDLQKNKWTLIYRPISHKRYAVCEDGGAPVNESCFLAIQKGKRYFKINPQYRCAVAQDTLYLFQAVSFEYSKNGSWVFIEKKFIEGKENIHFTYDTIPTHYIPNRRKGVFHLKNDSLIKVGSLSTYHSLHELPDVGFYYLSTPGLFYEKAVAIKDMN